MSVKVDLTSANRRRAGVWVAALLLALCVCLGVLFREQIGFFFNLYRVNRMAQAFYTDYEHLARDVAFDPK